MLVDCRTFETYTSMHMTITMYGGSSKLKLLQLPAGFSMLQRQKASCCLQMECVFSLKRFHCLKHSDTGLQRLTYLVKMGLFFYSLNFGSKM